MMNIPTAAMITVSSKGQVVIPKEFRIAAGLDVGSKVILECHEDGTLELHPMHCSIREIFGIGKKWAYKRAKSTNDASIMAVVAAEDEVTKTRRGNKS
jgi:AbrB family looped-hinge helix DNA binding protein